ncbi:hypothetical protein EVAR_40957_1 [Eumeta japonica]|uniref:Uncharacterized protein n=1 Tax=Eumeta variegata TaxID=151549 RepID=A0A4C1X802_EUMVA|nr:hypothetical protein EVAR_40957_1 [Eumeta japonica]
MEFARGDPAITDSLQGAVERGRVTEIRTLMELKPKDSCYRPHPAVGPELAQPAEHAAPAPVGPTATPSRDLHAHAKITLIVQAWSAETAPGVRAALRAPGRRVIGRLTDSAFHEYRIKTYI